MLPVDDGMSRPSAIVHGLQLQGVTLVVIMHSVSVNILQPSLEE